MKRQQTYIIVLEDNQGRTIDFERWTYKRAQTCISKMVALYRTLNSYSFARDMLDRTARVVCYPTPNGYHESVPVWSVTANEFRAMLEEVTPA